MRIEKVYRLYFGPGSDGPKGKQYNADAGKIGFMQGLHGTVKKINSELLSESQLGWLDIIQDYSQGDYSVAVMEHEAWKTPSEDYFSLVILAR